MRALLLVVVVAAAGCDLKDPIERDKQRAIGAVSTYGGAVGLALCIPAAFAGAAVMQSSASNEAVGTALLVGGLVAVVPAGANLATGLILLGQTDAVDEMEQEEARRRKREQEITADKVRKMQRQGKPSPAKVPAKEATPMWPAAPADVANSRDD